MLEERCLFLLTLKKEQAIDEYYRQVGGSWLFFVAFSLQYKLSTPKTCIYQKKLVSLHTFCVQVANLTQRAQNIINP